MNEPLIHKTPKGEFETMIWERHMNKALSAELKAQREENGKLQSEMDEMKHTHKKDMDELMREMRTTNLGQVVAKKKLLATQVSTLSAKNKKLKQDNDELMSIIIEKNKIKPTELFESNVEEGAG